ncbi:MAG: hypothetical protein JWN98_596 [Abditibacteriota bacterium]|nr:hypothetical protein [Abditibacteriota bacterium]
MALFSLWRRNSAGVDIASPAYRDAVSAFYVGLSALQAGDTDRAAKWLPRATELAPDEAAAWANLGVFQMRNNDFEKAAQSFAKARELAPQSSAIEELLGVLESAQGRSPEANAHFKRAVELDQANLRARYALFQELQRAGDEASEKEALTQISAILKEQPNNLLANLEALRLAAKNGDAATLKTVLQRLTALSTNWDQAARDQLKAVQTAASNPRSAAVPSIFLSNLLKPLPAYRDSLSTLANEAGETGRPIVRFLKWPQPNPAPAAPDLALSFTAAPAANAAKSQLLRAFWPTGEGTPLLISATQSTLNVSSTTPISLPLTNASDRARTIAIDWNNDYQNDILALGDNGLKFFQNAGKTMRDVTASTKLAPTILTTKYFGAWTLDAEADGDLDLILGAQSGATQVLRNNGDGTWAPWPLWSTLKNLRHFATADWDRDGDSDVALLDSSGQLHLFTNERSGQFGVWKLPADVPKLAAIAAGDIGNRGALDVAALAQDGSLLRFFFREEGEEWQTTQLVKAAAPTTLAPETTTLLLADFDNNGGIDALQSTLSGTAPSGTGSSGTGSSGTGNTTKVWLANIMGAPEALPATIEGAVHDVADVDGDGRVDLLGVSKTGATVWTNKGSKPYHWVAMRLRAAATSGDNRINTFGIGGQVEARAGLLLQIQPVERPLVHFGLGENQSADVARVGWPDGTLQGEFAIASDKPFFAEQRLKGSCPYLWTWDGTKFVFVKDCNWRSPLGLKINAQDTAGVVQTQDWVKVRGDQLKPRNGTLEMRVTADLWETHYFDEVALLTVDHPADTQVWVDERFSIPMPPLKVLSSGPLHTVPARDEKNRDVSELVATEDGRYLDTFALGRYQGVARDHWVELDLSAAPANKPLLLIASGWLYPTDSSINVALGQGRHEGPRGLSLEVPDGRGGWRVAREGLGFPAGKNKNITLDLRGVLTGEKKLRLRTNLEIFWDRLAWAEQSTSQPTITRLRPESATLRYRGITQIKAKDLSSPELPLGYDAIERRVPRWRDLEGFHTRFGDVKELVTGIDDRYVLMNAGDEMLTHFKALAPPPQGWVRDYVFITDGWTKDGNLNTTDSQTVHPLPAHDRTDYTRTRRLQDDPIYRRHARDWQTYHTRYVRPTVANALRVD